MKEDHIVMVPLPYQGHINPMLQLGKALQSRFGFSITIAHTIYNSPKPNHHPGFAFFSMPEGLPERGHVAAEFVAGDILTVNENCRESFRRFVREMRERVNIRCVVSDEFMFFAEEVAIDLKLPSLILRTASAATSFARDILISLTNGGRLPLQGRESHELVPEIPPLRYKDLPFSVAAVFEWFVTVIEKSYLNRKYTAIIWNTAECLEKPNLDKLRALSQVPIFDIGPIHMASPERVSASLINEDTSCISWLEKQYRDSVIYVSSLGSIATLSEKEAAEVALGLANTKLPFLWVIRPGSICGSEWTELLPEGFFDEVGDRGLVVKWAPQKDVLRHGSVGGFWSHCGWNSTLESLSEGVPMICRPCFGDQRVNVRYLSHVWRVGLELEGLERGEIERAVRTLMLEDQGNEMRERARDWKLKFKACTSEGGRSYECFNELAKFINSL